MRIFYFNVSPSLIKDEVDELMQLFKKKFQTRTSILILNLLTGVNSVVAILPLTKNPPPSSVELFQSSHQISEIGTMFDIFTQMSVSLKLQCGSVFLMET